MAFFFPANVALLCETASRQVRIRLRRLLFQGPYPRQTIARNTVLSNYQLHPEVRSLCGQIFLPLRSFMLSHLESTLIRMGQADTSNSFRSNTYDSPPKCCKQKTCSMAKSFRCNTTNSRVAEKPCFADKSCVFGGLGAVLQERGTSKQVHLCPKFSNTSNTKPAQARPARPLRAGSRTRTSPTQTPRCRRV
jgi:hypothetical protein